MQNMEEKKFSGSKNSNLGQKSTVKGALAVHEEGNFRARIWGSKNTIEVYTRIYSTARHRMQVYNTTTFTHRTCLLDSSPANTVKIPGGCGKFSPTQSTTLSRTDMLRLCNSLTRQVERSQEATNAKRQLNSSHIINSLKRSRLRERFSSKVDNFLSEATQFVSSCKCLKVSEKGNFSTLWARSMPPC